MLDNIVNWFTETWEKWQLTIVDDGWDNEIETWVKAEDVIGRFRPLSGERKVASDKSTIFVDAKFYCPIETDISEGDELRKDSNRYKVVFVQNVMSMDKFLQVELKFHEEN